MPIPVGICSVVADDMVLHIHDFQLQQEPATSVLKRSASGLYMQTSISRIVVKKYAMPASIFPFL